MSQEAVTPREYPEFYLKQAEHCRWLARNSSDLRTIEKLNTIACDFDARAAALQASVSKPK